MARHNKLLLTLIVLSSIAFVCTVLFSALADTALIKGLFLSTTSTISSEYTLEITPAGWTSAIWPIIYIWNGAWLIYALSTIFRRNDTDYAYCAPNVHPATFFALWICANLFHIGWLFFWDKQYFIAALYLITLIPISCFVMLGLSYKNCFKHGAWLNINSPADLWCIRILVHNGLATYATWTCIMCLINFGLVLKYNAGVEDSRASSIVLYLVMFGLLFWFLLESFLVEEFVRYTVTVYPVAAVALFGIFLRKGMPTSNLSEIDIIIAVVMAVSIVACFLRLILLFLCDSIRPLFPVESYKPLTRLASISDHSTSEGAGEVSACAAEEIQTES